MNDDQNTVYGIGRVGALPFTTGKTFLVVGSASANKPIIDALFVNDKEGIQRVHTSYTLALAQCVTGRGDTILTAPDFSTVPTAAELLAMETKGVSVLPAGVSQVLPGVFRAYRATGALPQTTQSALFTIRGRVRIVRVVGEVTTVIQTQLDNAKLVANPTVGADVDICAVKDITAAAVGTQLNITGTFATAMVQTASGAFVDQASPVVVAAGTLDLSCSASNTGSVKWMIDYQPLDPGAVIVAA